MEKTIFVDDDESFVGSVKEVLSDHDIKESICLTSVEEALKIIAEAEHIKRFVADLVFEGSFEDGIKVLEKVKQKHPETECVLLTGYKLNDTQIQRLKKIHGQLVHKTDLSEDQLCSLLSGESVIQTREPTPGPRLDAGELRLRYDKVNALLDEIISDIYEELESIENQNEPAFIAGNQRLSIVELKQHLMNRDDLGIEIIRMYQALNRKLRRFES